MTESSARVIWLYGLPGAGKTTLATEIAAHWRAEGKNVVILDGDELRRGLSSDLGFNDQQREENIRRAAHVAALLCSQAVFVVAALVTPLRRHRELVGRILQDLPHELRWLDCPPAICESRRIARDGLHAGFSSEFVFETPS